MFHWEGGRVMSQEVINSGAEQEEGLTVYGLIGLAIYVISVGVVYLIPNSFPDGTLYLIAGVLILIVTVLNAFKGIAYEWLTILFATVSIVIGVNKMFAQDIKFLPPILIAIGVVALFNSIKKLRNQ